MARQFTSDDVRFARYAEKVDNGQDEIEDDVERARYYRGKDVLKSAKLVRGETHVQTMWGDVPAGAVLLPDGWVGTEQKLTAWTLTAK